MTGRVIGTVSELARYPVKSMAGEVVQSTEVSNAGVDGDRLWALRNLDTGELTGAKQIPGLLLISASQPGNGDGGEVPHVQVTFPDGTTMSSADESIHERLSRQLDRPVRLEPLQPANNRKHYRLARLRSPKQLRQLLGVSRDGGLPDMSVLPWSMLYKLSFYATPPGTYADVYPIHFLTTRSMQSLARLAMDADVKMERFRPNLVIDTEQVDSGASGHGDEDYPELGWAGSTLTIGDVVLRVVAPTFRCAMPSHAQPGISKNPAVVKAVYRELDSKFGAYAMVVSAGTIAVGDPVVFEPAPHRGPLRRGVTRFGNRLKRFALDSFMAFGRRWQD